MVQHQVMVTNADGTTTAKTLTELGITEINLKPDATHIELPDGSVITGQTTFLRNGVTRTVADTTLSSDAEGHRVVPHQAYDSRIARVFKPYCKRMHRRGRARMGAWETINLSLRGSLLLKDRVVRQAAIRAGLLVLALLANNPSSALAEDCDGQDRTYSEVAREGWWESSNGRIRDFVVVECGKIIGTAELRPGIVGSQVSPNTGKMEAVTVGQLIVYIYYSNWPGAAFFETYAFTKGLAYGYIHNTIHPVKSPQPSGVMLYFNDASGVKQQLDLDLPAPTDVRDMAQVTDALLIAFTIAKMGE